MNKIFEPVKLKNLTVKNRLVRSATWEGFRSADKIEEVLNHTNIKMISLSRPLLCEPDWPNKIFEDAGALSKSVYHVTPVILHQRINAFSKSVIYYNDQTKYPD